MEGKCHNFTECERKTIRFLNIGGQTYNSGTNLMYKRRNFFYKSCDFY